MTNTMLYNKGENEFFSRFHDPVKELEQFEKEEIENLIWSAKYNDNYGIRSVAEGFFILTEYDSEEAAEEYIKEYLENGWTMDELEAA